ncbi:MAG: leucine-rich repeat domain-containing protein [Faecousia sp.]
MKKALIILLVLLLLGGLVFGLLHFFWTAENFASLGDNAMADGKYDRAVKRYETAAELDPQTPEYVLKLADACIADGSYTKAERSLVSAIRTAPSVELYCKLSSVYVAQDKLLDSQKMLDSITDPAIRAEIDAMRPAAPAFSYESGEYDEYIELSLSGNGGQIYYSTTEQYPSVETEAYTSPITLPAGKTHISAILVGENNLVSSLVEADYLIVGVVEEVSFTSPELESYVRNTLYIARTEPVMTDDLWTITELTVPDTMTDLSDLRYFKNLTTLNIHIGVMTDYSFLTELSSLETLDLSGCLLSSEAVGYIGGLSSLTSLNLSGCGISNIQPLSALSELTVLDLSQNSISDISPLAELKKLTVLDLHSNAVSSLSALKGAVDLTELDISENSVSDLAPLSGCTKLETLRAGDNRITSVSALSSMPKLVTFTASKNGITDISPLSGCAKLSRLELAENSLTSVEVLSALVNVTYLDISRNEITALPTIEAAAHLQQFYASYNQLEDISMLKGLPELTYVDVDYNENIEDIECLASCPLLVQINAFGTKVKEVATLTQIGVIVNYNPVEDEDAE